MGKEIEITTEMISAGLWEASQTLDPSAPIYSLTEQDLLDIYKAMRALEPPRSPEPLVILA
jgi:hypothetical protein